MAFRMSWSASRRMTFRITVGVQLFLPLEMHPRLQNKSGRFNRDSEWMYIYGRLSPDVGMEQANAAVSAVTARLAATVSGDERVQGGIRRALRRRRI